MNLKRINRGYFLFLHEKENIKRIYILFCFVFYWKKRKSRRDCFVYRILKEIIISIVHRMIKWDWPWIWPWGVKACHSWDPSRWVVWETKVLNKIFFKIQVWKIWINYNDSTFTDVIRRRENDLASFQVEVRGKQALKVEGAELINRTQGGGKTSPLGGSQRKLSIESAASQRCGINYWNPN